MYIACLVIISLHLILSLLILPSITLKARIFAPMTNGLIRLLHHIFSSLSITFINSKLKQLIDEIEMLQTGVIPDQQDINPPDIVMAKVESVIEGTDHDDLQNDPNQVSEQDNNVIAAVELDSNAQDHEEVEHKQEEEQK